MDTPGSDVGQPWSMSAFKVAGSLCMKREALPVAEKLRIWFTQFFT